MRALMLALSGLFLAGCVAGGGVHHGYWHGPVHAVPVYRAPPPVYVAPAWRPPPRVYAAPAPRPRVYHPPRHWHGHHHRGWHGPRHHHHHHRRHHGHWRH